MNPVALDAFDRLDGIIEKRVAAKPHGFTFFSIGKVLKIDPNFLYLNGCVTYRDTDHFSACGEQIVGDRLKTPLTAYLTAN